jgi:CheY-like chemotaxis protein
MLKNPLPNLQYHEFQEVPFKELMQKRVYNVLIVCSNYDYYLIEEDGRIDEQIFNEYATLNLRYPPNFLHASSARKAIDVLQTVKIDLVITFLDLVKGSFETAQRIKLHFPDVPIVALSHYSDQLRQKLLKENAKIIDDVFHWNGDVDIFLAIIKLTEDRMNAEKDILGTGVKSHFVGGGFHAILLALFAIDLQGYFKSNAVIHAGRAQ